MSSKGIYKFFDFNQCLNKHLHPCTFSHSLHLTSENFDCAIIRHKQCRCNGIAGNPKLGNSIKIEKIYCMEQFEK